jgi:type VI secretion system secreted protein VgrG
VGVTPAALAPPYFTGFPPGSINGGTALGPASVADQALFDINAAAIALSGLAMTSGGDLSTTNLGNGRTLTPGVYVMSDTTALLDGTLNLDATSNSSATFVFKLAFALTTGSTSVVNVIGGNSNTQVYWLVGSQATLGSGSTFAGNILAGTSITFDSTAKIECGRAFARTGSVTLIDNLLSGDCAAEGLGTLPSDFGSLGFSGSTGGTGGTSGGGSVPEPGTLMLLGMGLGVGPLLLRKFRSAR